MRDIKEYPVLELWQQVPQVPAYLCFRQFMGKMDKRQQVCETLAS
jgi:hypothetical protein